MRSSGITISGSSSVTLPDTRDVTITVNVDGNRDSVGTYYGIAPLGRSGAWTGKGNGTGTVGNDRSWSLSLSQTSVIIYTWYYTLHFPVLVPVPSPCSVTKPLVPLVVLTALRKYTKNYSSNFANRPKV